MRTPTVKRTAGPGRWLALLLMGCAGVHAGAPMQAPVTQLPPGTPSAPAPPVVLPPQAQPPGGPVPNAQVQAPAPAPPQTQPQVQGAPIPPPAPAPPQGMAAPRPMTPPLPPVTAAAPRPPLPPATPAPPAPPVKGLPAGTPSLVIQGAAYSANPQLRRLIVNNEVVREGADLGGGVQLREIGPDSAVLAVRGADYTVRY